MESVFQLCNPLEMYKRIKLFLLMAGTFLGIAAPFVQGQEDDSVNCIVSSQDTLPSIRSHPQSPQSFASCLN